MEFRVRYSRIRNGLKNTLVTVRDGDKVFFGISRCNIKKDTFIKKFGVEVARGRVDLAVQEVNALGLSFDGDRNLIATGNLRGVVKLENVKELLNLFEDLE
jgi:hypothetical protein